MDTPKFDHFYTCEDVLGKNGCAALERKPRVTACYLTAGNHTAVGLAICALDDNPSKRQGRTIALERAKYAFGVLTEFTALGLLSDICLLPINRESALDILFDVNIARSFYRGHKAFVVRDTPDFRIKREKRDWQLTMGKWVQARVRRI